jgi:hypothetical protein
LDIGGSVSFEVDFDNSAAEQVDYSTDADITFTASTATEYGALIAHIELEADDIVTSQNVGAASALMYDDVYVMFGNDLYVKAGYYDGVGDVGDNLNTSDFTGQGDTVGMGYGMDDLAFRVDVLLDTDDLTTTGTFVEGVGADFVYSGIENLVLGVAGSAGFAGSPAAAATAFGAMAWASYSMDALSVTARGTFNKPAAGANVFGGWVTVGYDVTDALAVSLDAEYQNVAASNYFINAGVDYTVTTGLVVGANVGVKEAAGANAVIAGADVTRSF